MYNRFFASAWKCPQTPEKAEAEATISGYKAKLMQ